MLAAFLLPKTVQGVPVSELGAYYVTIIPSLRGATKQIEAELRGVDAAGAGKTIGETVSRSVGQSLNFQSVGKKLQQVGGHISSIGDQLTKYITIPATLAATAVGGIAAAAGWRRLVGIDTARGQFKGLGYDADAVMKQVSAGLEGTSIAMQDGAALAVGALATGNLELEDLEAQLQRVANVSAAYGLEASHAGYLLNNVLTKNKVEWGDLSQMQQNQIPIVTSLADYYGVAADEIQKMAQDGKISVEDLNAALDQDAGQAAAAYADTWEGVRDNILAHIGRLSAAMQEGAFNELKEQAQDFLSFLETDEATAWAESIGESITTFAVNAINAIRSLIEWWTGLSDGTQKAILTMAGIVVVAGPVLSIVGRLVSVIGRVTSAIGTLMASPLGQFIGKVVARSGLLNSALVFLGNVFLRIIGPIGLVVGALVGLWKHSEAFREGVIDLGNHVWEALQQIGSEFQRLWEGLQPLFAGLAPAVEGAFGIFETYVLPVIEFVFGLIFTIIKGVIDNIVGVITGIVDVVTGVVAFFQAIFTGDFAAAWEAVKQIVMGAVTAVWNIIQLWLVGRVLQIFRGFGSTISTLWSSLWTGIRTFVTTIWNAIVTLFSNVWTRITSIIRGGASGAHGTVVSVFSAIRSFFSTVWNAILTLISTVWNSIRAAVSSGANAVRNVVSSAFNTVRNVVSSVMNGARNITVGAWNAIRSGASSAVNGMRNAVSGGFNAVTNTIRNLPNTIRNVFSNAGSWLINAGKNILAGLTQGIRSAISGPVDAVRNGVQRIRNLLPFSPAKDGPLSGKGYTLFSGEALIEDLAKGISKASPDAIRSMSNVVEALAEQTDLSAAMPDFVPGDWHQDYSLAGVGAAPSARSFASTGSDIAGRGGTTVQMTNEFTQADPDEAVAIMWSTLRSKIRANGGGDIGANPNA